MHFRLREYKRLFVICLHAEIAVVLNEYLVGGCVLVIREYLDVRVMAHYYGQRLVVAAATTTKRAASSRLAAAQLHDGCY
jgi:hypothetical protein